jgi:uncharacterized protein YfaS (alpha-2-macroglobulin family)
VGSLRLLRILFAFGSALLCMSACAPRKAPVAPNASPAPVAVIAAPNTGGFVASVAPTGKTDTRAQVLVRFSGDVIPLERLESPAEAEILAHFSLEPALPGRFRLLTPRMVGFQADRAWPAATRVRITVTKGLRDMQGRKLDDDVSWTFETSAIEITGLPGTGDDTAIRDLQPKISLQSNVALERSSLEANAVLRNHAVPASEIALAIPPDTATAAPSAAPDPDAAFDPANGVWRYALVPKAALEKGTRYDVVIRPGVRPRDGNRPSEKSFTGSFVTYAALALRGVTLDKPGSRFTNGDPRLVFSTPIDEKSVSALMLSPPPPAGVRAFDARDEGVAIATNLLAPNTTYTVTAGAGLTDRFGQLLGSARTARFRTADLLPDVWAPDGTHLFASSRDVRLNVVAVNPPSGVRAIFAPLKPRDIVLRPDPFGEPDRGDVLPPSASWPAFDASGTKNLERTIPVPLRAKLGAPAGVLAYGVAAPASPQPFVASGVVQLTDLGVFAQFFPSGGSVRVNRISDGTPVGGARVEVYVGQAQLATKGPVAACSAATTDANGAASFGGPAFAGCSMPAARGAAGAEATADAPSLVTIVRLGTDWTYVRTDSYSGAYAGDFYNGWSTDAPLSRGTVFSDRALYKPGETAQLTAIGWFLADGRLRRGLAPSYGLVLEAPDGKKRDLGRRSLDAFATFALPVTLPKDAPLGTYTVRASAGLGEEIIGNFRVAEFKAPNFKVDLTLDHDIVARGTTVAAHARNAYLFGAPLAGASTKFTVTRSPVDFTPAGRDAFTYGRHWFWPDQTPDAATDVLEATVRVDADGKNGIAVPVAADLPYPMAYRVDAETTDVSNLAVADSQTFTALPSATLVGVRVDEVGIAGTPLRVALLATDVRGAPLAGTRVRVELQRASYASATQIVEGAEVARESVSYATVGSADVTTAADSVSVALTPPKPGTYRVRATLAGAAADASETDVETYVGGPGETAWYGPDPSAVTIKLDKSAYQPGEVATALVQSPFPDAELHVAVVRHGVLWQTALRATSPAPTVRFTVTPEMLPNAVVEAFIVRRGPPPNRDSPDAANALARVGFVGFSVALDAKYLHVTARPQAGVLEPGARQTLHVHIEDAAHRPLLASATVIVANDAVLQLTGYRPPDLVKLVYADQPIATRYADNRATLVLQTLARPQEKGFGYGGGLSGEEVDPRVRRAFSPLAYFAGALRTDAHGDATAAFTLPDDLTTWRVMVVAASADGRFGNSETTFHTTKPLVANPVLPQFARPGDRFDGGLALTNGTRAQGNVRIDAGLTGPLAFLIDGKTSAATSLEAAFASVTKAYRFPIVATGTGEATATMNVRGATAGDAFAIALPVHDESVSEAVVQTGATASTASVAFDVAADTPADSGGLDVLLAASLVPDVVVAARGALQGDERVSLAAASRLAVASDLVLLAARSGSDATRDRARAGQELATLRGLQRASGGFAPYWQAGKADAWDSLDVLAALARARAAKLDDGGTLAGAQRFAAAVLADPAHSTPWCTSDVCKAQLRVHALAALTAAGDRRTTFLSAIDAQRNRLSFADQIRLARLLRASPAYADRAATLAKSIDDRIATSARGAIVNLPARYGWYEAPVVTQALVLQFALDRNLPQEPVDALTRSLLGLRRNGSFGCACATAAALDALVAVAAREVPASFSATAQLGTATVARATFGGVGTPESSTTVPARDLPRGKSSLALSKTGTGTLHYAVTYRYRIAGPAPGRLSGLRITRIVRPASSTAVLATFGLAAPATSASLAAGGVYDIDLEIITDHPVERVTIADALPAGLEAVDTTFATTSTALGTPSTSWGIGDRQIHTDRIEAYADALPAGIYHLHYLARGVTSGTYAWPGADVHLIDTPDEFGRSAAAVVDVK